MNAKSPYVKLSMLKTINKPKAAAGDAIFDVRLFSALMRSMKQHPAFAGCCFLLLGNTRR